VDLYGTAEASPGGETFFVVERVGGLVLEQFPFFYRFRLLPLQAANRFLVEDLGLLLVFQQGEDGAPVRPVFHASEEMERLYTTFVRGDLAAGVRQYQDRRSSVASEFELRYLAHNLRLAGREEAAVVVLKLRMLGNPESSRAHRDFVKAYLERGDLRGLSHEYAEALRGSEAADGPSGLVRWFAEWVKARAYPAGLSEAAKHRYVGDYGPRHVVAQEDGLYYHRGDRATATEYRLLHLSEHEFVLDGIDYFRIRFVVDDDGKATAIIGSYLGGHQDESPRSP
jgi:hypothetical protein